jgi:putative cell wall-binding protein
VLGGTSAVSDEVAEAVAEYASVEARRVSGPDRWATAANISSGFVAPVDTVYVASGLDYPDALTGGAAIGGTTGGPLLLVLPNEVPSATAAELTRLKPTNLVVLGGTAAISDAVVTALAPYATNTPIRRSGADRYETALQVATAFASAPVVYLSRGDAFADALAAGASAGFRKGPILLVPHDCIPFDVDLAIQRLGATEVIVLGGTAALSDAVLAGTPC